MRNERNVYLSGWIAKGDRVVYGNQIDYEVSLPQI